MHADTGTLGLRLCPPGAFVPARRITNRFLPSLRAFQPIALDRYIIVQRYASVFLEESEAAVLQKESKRSYYNHLAQEALRFREVAFWRYHEKGLKTLGETLDWPYLIFKLFENVCG